jgi:NAD(P)-dependent dehydrogenase (short-subunit alcohol dehydrogenase family)
MVTKLFEQYPEREKQWPTENMLGRLSRPEEYRGAAVFLLSDASSFMTGEFSCCDLWYEMVWLIGLGSDMIIDGGHTKW